MQIAVTLGILILAYLLGSTPSGLLIVKIVSGKDIRSVESGRTGGTNAMRAAGFWAGIGTAFMDLFKATIAVWIARQVTPDLPWVHIFAGIAAIVGHNYSIFLAERSEGGRLRLRGGAGGAPAVGAALGLWPASVLVILPLAVLILYFGGYASLATLSVGIIAAAIFAYRAGIGSSPWAYAFYGLLAELVLLWSLRPNIRRLLNGTERLVGYRNRKKRAT
jgi:acyl phosphate:glycerol-3-phosphate acyltransferase